MWPLIERKLRGYLMNNLKIFNERKLNNLSESLSFYFWIEELKNRHPWQGYVTQDNKDCWRSYFEDGYTPEAAMEEDMSYAV